MVWVIVSLVFLSLFAAAFRLSILVRELSVVVGGVLLPCPLAEIVLLLLFLVVLVVVVLAIFVLVSTRLVVFLNSLPYVSLLLVV